MATITGILVALSLSKVSYYPNINKPSRIIVYYNNEYDNAVFESGSIEYNKIYSLIIKSHRQPLVKAMKNGELNKKAKMVSGEQKSLSLKGIKVCFVYNSPKVVKYKNQNYWYKSLIFNICEQNDFSYNVIAIIPPTTDVNYSGAFSYTLSYLAYSNFNKLYPYLFEIFN